MSYNAYFEHLKNHKNPKQAAKEVLSNPFSPDSEVNAANHLINDKEDDSVFIPAGSIHTMQDGSELTVDKVTSDGTAFCIGSNGNLVTISKDNLLDGVVPTNEPKTTYPDIDSSGIEFI